MRQAFRTVVAGGLAIASFASLTAACGKEDRATQLTIAISSETEIPKELDTLEVVVVASNGSEVSRVVHDVGTPRFFPTTLAVIPKDDDSLDRPVTIEVRGGKSTSAAGQVFRRAIVSYVEGRTLLVPMALRMACFNFRDCGPNQSCVGGVCRSAEVEAAALSDYAEARVFGGIGGAPCFDERACLAKSTLLEVRPDCTFTVPAGDRVNVSIRWAAAPDRVIALDGADADEGWTRVNETTGKMSAGICDSLLDPEPDPAKRRVPDRALDAHLSTACVVKTAAQPYCPDAEGRAGVGTPLTP